MYLYMYMYIYIYMCIYTYIYSYICILSIVFQGSAWALGPVQSLALRSMVDLAPRRCQNVSNQRERMVFVAFRHKRFVAKRPNTSRNRKNRVETETIREIRNASPRIWQVFEQERRWSHVLHAARCLVPGSLT